MTAGTETVVALIQLKKEVMVPVLIAGLWIIGWPLACVAIGFLLMI